MIVLSITTLDQQAGLEKKTMLDSCGKIVSLITA